MYNFDPYNVLLAIATNIPVLLMTASVLQGHKYIYIYVQWWPKLLEHLAYLRIVFVELAVTIPIKTNYTREMCCCNRCKKWT